MLDLSINIADGRTIKSAIVSGGDSNKMSKRVAERMSAYSKYVSR